MLTHCFGGIIIAEHKDVVHAPWPFDTLLHHHWGNAGNLIADEVDGATAAVNHHKAVATLRGSCMSTAFKEINMGRTYFDIATALHV